MFRFAQSPLLTLSVAMVASFGCGDDDERKPITDPVNPDRDDPISCFANGERQ